MIGTREENLGSTRSQTLEMRSPSTQAMKKANINMNNWIQETYYISAVTSGPDEPNNLMNHGIINVQIKRKMERSYYKQIILHGKQKTQENHT